jgi:hypothetical protein
MVNLGLVSKSRWHRHGVLSTLSMEDRETESPMRGYRLLVQLASLVQMGVGGYITYQLLLDGGTQFVELVLSLTAVFVGMASLSVLLAPKRPSLSRVATIKLNFMIFLLMCAAIAAYLFVQHEHGASLRRLQVLGAMALALSVPYLVNTMSLWMIERQAKRYQVT